MPNKLRTCFVAAPLLFGTHLQLGGQTSVSGVVIQASGPSGLQAWVEAVPKASPVASGYVGSSVYAWVSTDGNGRFHLTLKPGSYRILAKDEPSGFPDPVYWLAADSTAVFPEISVGAAELRDVRVIMGRKGAVVTGELVDDESGKSITNAKITFRDAKNSASFVEVFSDSSGSFRFTLPGKPILVSASANGYKPFDYNSGQPVTFTPDAPNRIRLKLVPTQKKSR